MKKRKNIPILESGAYLLFIRVRKQISAGRWEISKGTYIYVGKAKKGLKNRLRRHKEKDKKLRWHIDYITSSPYAKVEGITITSKPDDECKIAKLLSENYITIRGFGCSDCKCRSHLFLVKMTSNEPVFHLLKSRIGSITYIHP